MTAVVFDGSVFAGRDYARRRVSRPTAVRRLLGRDDPSPANYGNYMKKRQASLPVSLLHIGVDLFSRSVSRQVLSALVSLTAVFGMGTGGPSPLKTPTALGYCTLKTEQSEAFVSKACLHFSIVGQALGLLVSVS